MAKKPASKPSESSAKPEKGAKPPPAAKGKPEAARPVAAPKTTPAPNAAPVGKAAPASKAAPTPKVAPSAKAAKPAPAAAAKPVALEKSVAKKSVEPPAVPPPVPAPAVKAAPKAKAPRAARSVPLKAVPPKAAAPVVADTEDLDLEVEAIVSEVPPEIADFPVDENGEVILPTTDVEEAPAPKKEVKPKEVLPIPKDLPPRRADGTITVAHSPDADDAFMFYALANGKVDTEDRKYEHVLKDIQTLNEAAKKGTYDLTAISFHAYPYVRRNYALLTCGASFGDAYGPVLVAKTPIRPNEVDGMTVAVPGELTTAALVTRMWFGRAKIDAKYVPFDKVTDLVRAGLVRAGVIIHEGQLTYKELGLVRVVDFGQWWSDSTEGLPLPLGGNGIRRDIPAPLVSKIALDLKRSIAYALGHREEALAYAMKFGRNLPKEKADKFVGMYVNDLTLDYGERGRQAVKYLLDRAFDEGLLKERIDPEFVG